MKGNFEYKFKGDLPYIREGENVKAKTITIKAPANIHKSDALEIEQEFEKSQFKMLESLPLLKQTMGEDFFKEAQKQKGKKIKSKEETPQSVIKNMMSGDANIEKCIDCLENILVSSRNGVHFAYIDGKEPITSTIIDDIPLFDMKNILGEYIINFTAAFQDN